MRFGRQDRFADLVERMLDLVAVDEAALLEEAATAEAAWTASDREGAEEAYGDFQLVVDAIADRLLEARDSYAATLSGAAREAFVDSFNREAAKRFRRYASIVADLTDDLG
ncbi:MAG: hypothetical protein ACKVUT_07545 [Gaiella sp.]